MMSPSPSPTGRRRLSKEERAALAAPLPESYRSLSQPEIDALWRTGTKVEQRRLGREGLLPSWLLVRATNRAGQSYKRGDRVRWRGHNSPPRKGLSYSAGGGILTDDAGSGWDVVDVFVDEGDQALSMPIGGTHEASIYSFSIGRKLSKSESAKLAARTERIMARLNRADSQIINPYPGESAGQAVFGSARKYDDEIREAMARAFFVDWYASEQERRQEEGLKANIARGGEDWMDVAPGTSRAAKKHAREYAVKLSAANKGATLTDLYAAALNAGGSGDARTFGHYMAMQAMGHGVSWFDDNPEFPIEVPHGEFYQ